MRHRVLLSFSCILLAVPALAQTHPSPVVNDVQQSPAGRPVPGPVFEIPAFTRAVERGTRTRTGQPGAKYWTQQIRYAIDATLDPAGKRIRARERVVYTNRSPDTLRTLAVHLRQNVFAPGSPRRESAPITGGMPLERVTVNGRVATESKAVSVGQAPTGSYVLDGTVMWIVLATPLAPHDSVTLDIAWSYTPALSPSDGRQGRESDVYVVGYWYPQIAVYDDVHGWVADPYLLEAEFYMEPADYDVRITAPRAWLIGATGTLTNADSILSREARARLGEARRTGEVVHVATPEAGVARAVAAGRARVTWHFAANAVRDFAWGATSHSVWDATRALVRREPDSAPDTVMIHSFYRRHAPAAAWAVGGARYTRDAIEGLSDELWPYPWPQMTSMEGVLTGGGMEYPMFTAMQPWADTLSLAGDLMHETGHMWFPMQVGSNETRYPWMDEGFTQFDAAQAMRVRYGEPRTGGRPNDSEPGQRERYLRAVRAGLDEPLMTAGDNMPRESYSAMYYDKTAQALASLRAVLGDSVFHQAFRAYGKRWIGKHPYPYDFFNSIAQSTGQDLSWFWSTWFFNAWPLDQAIASVTVRDSIAEIVVEDRGLAPMPVLLSITRADGSGQQLELPADLWLDGSRRQTVRVGATPAITRVEIDPDARFADLQRANQVWAR